MPKTIVNLGVAGEIEVEVDKNGFFEVPVIIQENNRMFADLPAEMRILICSIETPDFNRAYCAMLNRKTDLPFYLGTAKIKVIGKLTKITDDDLATLGITPFRDD